MDATTIVRALAAAVATLLVAGGCSAVQAPAAPAAAVGRIDVIDRAEGYVIADFPSGRMSVYVGKRQLDHYVEGDEIRIDRFGRPLPP